MSGTVRTSPVESVIPICIPPLLLRRCCVTNWIVMLHNAVFAQQPNARPSINLLFRSYMYVHLHYGLHTCSPNFTLILSVGLTASITFRSSTQLNAFYPFSVTSPSLAEFPSIVWTHGCRVNGKLNWFQIFSNGSFTLFSHNKKRGSLLFEGEDLLMLFTGIVLLSLQTSYACRMQRTH